MHILRRIPIEAYVLIALPVLGLAAYFTFFGSWESFFSLGQIKALTYYFFFGGHFLLLSLIIVNLYVVGGVLLSLGAFVFDRNGAAWRDAKDLIAGHAYFLFILAASSTCVGVAIETLSYTPHEEIARASDALMAQDLVLFDSYTAFSLPGFAEGSALRDTLGVALLRSYTALPGILGAMLLLFLAAGRLFAKKFLLFFFLTQIVSIPIWAMYPALSPLDRYIEDILQIEAPPEVQKEFSRYTRTPLLLEYHEDVNEARERAGGFFALTTMPSMHAAWGIGLAYYGTLLFPPLGVALIPWAILQMAGAVYTAQHYAVDIVAGALIAFLVIALVEVLLRAERSYSGSIRDLQIAECISRDLRATCRVFKGLRQRWIRLWRKASRVMGQEL